MAMAGSLVELETLLSLPDGIPHERVPVDDYWSDYLQGLSTLAAQKAVPANTGPCDSPCLSDSCTHPGPDSGPASGGLIPSDDDASAPLVVQLEMHMPPQVVAATAAFDGLAWASPLAPDMLPAMVQPGGGLVAAAMPPFPLLGMNVNMNLVSAGKQALAKNGKSELNGRMGPSSQRQATNREAQKRYRERQKARLLEMQVTIDTLQCQLAKHRDVHQHNLQLEEQHYRLQAQLARVENEAESLQWQRQQTWREVVQLRRESPKTADGAEPMEAEGGEQQQQAATSVANSAVGERHDSVGSLSTHSDTACDSPKPAPASEQRSGPAEQAAAAVAEAVGEATVGMYGLPPPHEAFDDLLARFYGQVGKVKSFLDEQQLRQHHPAAVLLSASTRGQLITLMQESLGICRDLLRVEGADVIDMLQRQDEELMAANGTASGSHVRNKWLHVIQVLQLTPEQKQQLLLQRNAHLALMRRIYQQRQQLNMQAMSLMLLGPSGTLASGSGDHGLGGCGAVARATGGTQAAKLAAVLNLIKENLRREQRAAMEINSCTLSRILTPVQTALYIAEAFPLHCDALGLCNVLSTMGAGDKTNSGAGSAGTPGNSMGASPLSSS